MYSPVSNSILRKSGRPGNCTINGGELTHSYATEGEVKMTRQEIIEMIHRAGFEAVERDTVKRVVAV